MLQLFVRRLSFSLARQSKAEWKRRKVHTQVWLQSLNCCTSFFYLQDRKLVDWRRVRVWGGAGGDGYVNFRRSVCTHLCSVYEKAVVAQVRPVHMATI